MVLQALKRYGMILADNGSPWYISRRARPRWNNDALHFLDRLTGKGLPGGQYELVPAPRPLGAGNIATRGGEPVPVRRSFSSWDTG